jgi:hypothetical protein
MTARRPPALGCEAFGRPRDPAHLLQPGELAGSVALSLCTAAHPLYTGFTSIIGTTFLKRQCDRTLGELACAFAGWQILLDEVRPMGAREFRAALDAKAPAFVGLSAGCSPL